MKISQRQTTSPVINLTQTYKTGNPSKDTDFDNNSKEHLSHKHCFFKWVSIFN